MKKWDKVRSKCHKAQISRISVWGEGLNRERAKTRYHFYVCSECGLPTEIKEEGKQLDEVQTLLERNRADKDTLREKLKFFMAENNLTLHDVALLIKKDDKTVWQFLRRKVKPHDGTLYSIKKLMKGPPKRRSDGKENASVY